MNVYEWIKKAFFQRLPLFFSVDLKISIRKCLQTFRFFILDVEGLLKVIIRKRFLRVSSRKYVEMLSSAIWWPFISPLIPIYFTPYVLFKNSSTRISRFGVASSS